MVSGMAVPPVVRSRSHVFGLAAPTDRVRVGRGVRDEPWHGSRGVFLAFSLWVACRRFARRLSSVSPLMWSVTSPAGVSAIMRCSDVVVYGATYAVA
jgi:hypothetical protein